MRPLTATTAAAALLVLTCSACAGSSDPPPDNAAPSSSSSAPSSSAPETTSEPTGTQVLDATVDRVVATGLEVPWGLAFLPDGSALVSERDSDRIKHVTPDGDVSDVGKVDGVDGGGEGGLLGIALSPTYESDHLLFAYYTRGDENVIARITYDDAKLSAPTGGLRRHPVRRDPQRRPAGLRTRRLSLRRHGRGGSPQPGAGQGRPRRQDPPDHAGR